MKKMSENPEVLQKIMNDLIDHFQAEATKKINEGYGVLEISSALLSLFCRVWLIAEMGTFEQAKTAFTGYYMFQKDVLKKLGESNV